MAEYRILAWNPTDGTATVQFSGFMPLNYALPIADNGYLSGEAFEAWVQSLHPQAREVDFSKVEGGEHISARVNGAALPVDGADHDTVQAMVDSQGFDEL